MSGVTFFKSKYERSNDRGSPSSSSQAVKGFFYVQPNDQGLLFSCHTCNFLNLVAAVPSSDHP